MPFVRISLMQGKAARFAQKFGAIVYRTMADTFTVAPGDIFQMALIASRTVELKKLF
jgi:hypothetical protein